MKTLELTDKEYAMLHELASGEMARTGRTVAALARGDEKTMAQALAWANMAQQYSGKIFTPDEIVKTFSEEIEEAQTASDLHTKVCTCEEKMSEAERVKRAEVMAAIPEMFVKARAAVEKLRERIAQQAPGQYL